MCVEGLHGGGECPRQLGLDFEAKRVHGVQQLDGERPASPDAEIGIAGPDQRFTEVKVARPAQTLVHAYKVSAGFIADERRVSFERAYQLGTRKRGSRNQK